MTLQLQAVNDLLTSCNNELSNYNNLLLKSTDKPLNRLYMKHISAIQKIIQSLQIYKNLETPEELKRRL